MYDLEKKSFSHFDYSFDMDIAKQEDIVPVAKKSIQLLETVIEKTYNLDTYSKVQTGRITPRIVAKGYRYRQKEPDFERTLLTRVLYKVQLDSSSVPQSLSLTVGNRDSYEKNILSIYDNIISIPILNISSCAEVQQENIQKIREGFDTSTYLH